MAGDRRVVRHVLHRIWSTVSVVVAVALGAGVTGWLVGAVASSVSGNKNAPWIIGRAAGLTSYVLLVTLVATGLVLSHPLRTRVRRPSSAMRIRLHVSLAMLTLALTALHVVVLATDSYAGVGWKGTFVPMGSTYRPVPVTVGVIGLYAGLLAGLTAALSGRRIINRVWWPIHKVSSAALILVWVHGFYAGIDTRPLQWFYLLTGAGVLALAVSRYTSRTPADQVAELESSPDSALRHGLHAVGTQAAGDRS